MATLLKKITKTLFGGVGGRANSIGDLKSSIAKHGGVAHENRFVVSFNPPGQTLFNLDLRNIITSLASKTFNPKSLLNSGSDITILCESCSLPGRQIMTLDYQAEKHAVKRPYSFFNEEVNFTFLLTNDYYMKKMFDKWSEQIMGFSNYRLNYLNDFVTDVTISQLNKEKNYPIYTVILRNAYPITFNSIALDNTVENSVQKFSVTMAYENFFVDSVPAEGPPGENDTQNTYIRYGEMQAVNDGTFAFSGEKLGFARDRRTAPRSKIDASVNINRQEINDLPTP